MLSETLHLQTTIALFSQTITIIHTKEKEENIFTPSPNLSSRTASHIMCFLKIRVNPGHMITWFLLILLSNRATLSTADSTIIRLLFHYIKQYKEGPLPEATPTESDRRILPDLVGFDRIPSDLVRFRQIRSDLVGFGQILISGKFGRIGRNW